MAAAFWLYAIYFLDQDRIGLFSIFSLLALMIKEEMGLILAFVGGYAILTKRRWKLGVTFVALGLTWFFVGIFWIQPLFSPIGKNMQFSRYAWLGSTPFGILVMSRHEVPGRVLPNDFFDFARSDISDIQYPTLVEFGDDLEFLGYNLIPNRENEVDVDLFFRPLHEIGTDCLVTLYLLNEQGQLLGATTQEPTTTVWYPTSRWQPGEVVRVRINAVPWNTDTFSKYLLAIRVLSHPDPWDVSARLRPKIVNSAWQGWLPADGTLLGIAQVEKVWGIANGSPRWRRFRTPTYAWVPGEVVPDHHLIHLDESMPAGEYTLMAGMYDSQTQERLPLLKFSGRSQDHAVVIGKISVK